MPGIFTLLNESYTLEYLRELCENENQKYDFKNVMIRTIFGSVNEKEILYINDIAIVCDGRIYNHKQLLMDLNIIPKTTYDYEVIIYLYEKFGIEYTLQNLDGIFSFVLVDCRITNEENLDAKLFVARDSYGIKPLYMMQSTNGDKLFALSSMKESLQNMLEKDADIVDILPGTYSSFYLKFKVLSTWELEKFQIPYAINKFEIHDKNMRTDYLYDTIYGIVYRILILPLHKLSEIIAPIYHKQFYKNNNMYVWITIDNHDNEEIKRSIEDIKNIKFYPLQNSKKNNEDDFITHYDWNQIAKEISEQFPKSIVMLDEFILYEINNLKINNENCNSSIKKRYKYQCYFKNIYKKINVLSKIFYEFGLEIDISLLDTEFVEYFLST